MPDFEFEKEVIERLTRIETKHDERHEAVIERLDKTNGRVNDHDVQLRDHEKRLNRASGVTATIATAITIFGATLLEWLFHRGGHR